jgi:FAD synthetase
VTLSLSQIQPKPGRVLVGGCFDILHYGHVRFLELAREQGACLMVALESDEAILETKKRHPIHTQEQRAHVLQALACVDEVVCLPRLKTYEDYLGVVVAATPEVIATTQGDPQLDNKRLQARRVGGRLEVVIPQLEGFSTTRIITLLGEHLNT